MLYLPGRSRSLLRQSRPTRRGSRRLCALLAVLLAGCGVPAQTADQAAPAMPGGSAPTSISQSPDLQSSAPDLQSPTPGPQSPTPAPSSGTRGTIAYLDGGNLWLLDLASGQSRQLTDDGQSRDPAWSPDGQSLAVTTIRAGLPQIELLRADGSERRAMTTGPGQASFPAFSPDGTLVFVRRPPGDTPAIQIVRRDAAGAETIVHSEPGGLCGPIGLSVAVDQRAALSLNCGRGSYTLISTPGVSETIDLGREIDAGVCAAPGVWAQRDTRIAAIAARECAYHQETSIVVVDRIGDAPQVRRVLDGSGIRELDWSPDGQWLVYARFTATGDPAGLWLIDSDGQNEPRQISPTGAQPAWRPDVSGP